MSRQADCPSCLTGIHDGSDCTCGHPYADHTALGECEFRGCGCGAFPELRRAALGLCMDIPSATTGEAVMSDQPQAEIADTPCGRPPGKAD